MEKATNFSGLSLLKVWAFAEWCADNYVRNEDWWVRLGVDPKAEDEYKSTAELWVQFSENYSHKPPSGTNK